jgi:hypothetical protein
LRGNKYYLFPMKYLSLIFIFLFFINTTAQTAKDFAADWDKQHFSKSAVESAPRRFEKTA